MKLPNDLNTFKLIKKISKHNRTKSEKILKSKSKSGYIQSRPQTSISSKIIKKNVLNNSVHNRYINKSTGNNINLNVLNLMIENNPIQYNYNKIKLKAKQINPIFIDNKVIVKGLTKNTQDVLYRYNILYGNNTQNFIRTYSPKMRPMSSSVKLFMKTIKESKEDKHILNDDELLILINAKCKDIGIDFRDIMFNKFKEFCNSKCKNRIADFSECYFGINSIKVISELLLVTNRISRLNLTKNNIGDIGLEILVNSVKNSISLVYLNVTSNSISHKGGNILFKSFINQQSIVDLNISSIEGSNRNRITSVGLKNIIIFLTKNIFIEVLNLSGNSIRNEGFIVLCKGLKNNIALQNLDISNNDIQEKGIKQGIEFIKNSKIYSKINSLNLSNNPILNGGIFSLTNNLRFFPNLKSINIAFCGIEFRGFNYFLRTAQYVKRMENLNVSGNKLKDDNFSDIKQYFCTFSIRYLNMSKCSLGDHSGYILGECLAVNETLKSINISGNEITDIGFKSYINLFKTNNSIEYFDCSCNFITDYTGRDFVKSLVSNQSLKSINLYDNQLHDEIGNLFIEVLEINRHITHVNLNYNRIQVKTIEDMNKILKINYDKQKISFIPDILKNIKELEFQPEQFTILSKKILEKKTLQNFLYKKVLQDDKNFCSLLEVENKKIEKEKKILIEIIKEKKQIENEILEIHRNMETNDRKRRINEEEIKRKIDIEKKVLDDINLEKRKIITEYKLLKDELMNAFKKTEKECKLSKEKYDCAKNYYDNKDREYIKKFSYYQDLINPNLLVPIQRSYISRFKSRKNLNFSAGNIYDDNVNKNNDNLRKIEDYKFNEKHGKMKLRMSSKNLPVKKVIDRQNNNNNLVSTSTTISTGNMNLNTDEKVLNSTFNRTFKFNKQK